MQDLGTVLGSDKGTTLAPQDAARELRKKDGALDNKSRVRVEIQMNGYVFIFGVPAMITLIILGTIVVFYFVGSSHHATLALERATQQPRAQESNPFLADQVLDKVMARLPEIAERIKPEVYIKVEPAQVTIPELKPQFHMPEVHPKVIVHNQAPEAPNVTVSLEGGQAAPKTITKIVEKIVEKTVPVYVETKEQAQLTMDDMYPIVERFLVEHCKRNQLDAKTEEKKWLESWQSRVKEEGDEQRLANRTLIEKRAGFDVEKAKPEQVVEICRLMLRFRDGQLALPAIFKEHVSAASLVKIKSFLENSGSTTPATLVKSQ